MIEPLHYEEINPVSRQIAAAILDGNDIDKIGVTLVALGLHAEDWQWVQYQALRFLGHENDLVVSSALLAIAHSARIHRSVVKEVVVALESLTTIRQYSGKAQDVLDDISLFVRTVV